MNIHELVVKLTRQIQLDFYGGKPREFYKDYRALVKAITRYGYECQQRGWEPDADSIYKDIAGILMRARWRDKKIDYLPAYLQTAITQHVNTRAEEIQARSASSGRTVSIVMDGMQPVANVVSGDAELLAKIHTSIIRKKSERKAPQQLSLL